MTGLSFANTRLGQRVLGNQVTSGYDMPAGWVDSVAQPTYSGKTEKNKVAVLLLMQPEKSLDLKPSQCPTHTYIRDFKKTEELVEVLQKQSVEDLQGLMGIGKKIAKSHLERFQNFQRYPAKQACLMFGGEALSAADFSEKEQRFADAHIRILSGLYGLLRPYDDVKPVRDLPIGAKLGTKRAGTVAAFWADSISKQLAKDAAELGKSGDRVLLVVCLSDEYWRVVQSNALPDCVDVVRLSFEGSTEEEVRRARGLLARHVVRKRVDDLEGLQDFSHDDWAFERGLSRESRLVFTWDGDASGACAPKEEKKKVSGCDPGYHSSGASDAPEDAGGGAGASRSRSRSSPPGRRSRSRSRSCSRPPARKNRQRSCSPRRAQGGKPSRRHDSRSRSRGVVERRRDRR